jgi:hypothetical protein
MAEALCTRYEIARSLYKDANTRLTAPAVVDAADVEEGLLLAGERSVGQILRVADERTANDMSSAPFSRSFA